MGSLQITLDDLGWPTLTGTILPGGYEVGELMAEDEEICRYRVRILATTSPNGQLDLFRIPDADADSQIGEWQKQRTLQHPNLSLPLSAGRIDQDGHCLIYVITQRPDETLAGVLRDRAIAAEEAVDIVRTVGPALAYLHANGRTHGHLAPEELLAFGDSIRISTEYSLQRNAHQVNALIEPKYLAPESSIGNVTPAADVWCLGATLFEALTQRHYQPERATEIASLPEPFDVLVARALEEDPQKRGTIGDLQAPRGKKSIPEPSIPEPALIREVTPRATVPEPLPARHTRRDEIEREAQRFPKWWLAAAAVLLLSVLTLWLGRAKHTVPSAPLPLASSTAPLPAKPASPITPASSSQHATPVVAPGPAPSKTSIADQPVWRVVVFTFNRQADAEKKASALNQKHHDLDAQVFSPNGRGPYLVAIGGRMTRAQAVRVRARVIGLGLPHDSYIQNFRS